jgi:hypothetical protein
MRDHEAELIGAFKEFKEWERIEHHEIRDALKRIDKKIDNLDAFKWKLVGASSAVALIVSTFGGLLVSHIIR